MSKLEEILKYVSEHNDFYKNRIKEYGIKDPLDITQWPILTRKELQENRYNMFSENQKIEYYENRLLRMSSSGTSGIPISVYWNYSQYYNAMLNIWRLRKKYYGITPKQRKVTFVTGSVDLPEKDLIISQKYKTNTLSIDRISLHDDVDFQSTIEEINIFRPEWIYSRPSLLLEFIEKCKAKGIYPQTNIKYIELTGEILDVITRVKIAEFFNVPIANMYGSEEIGPIAYECPFGKMHLLNNNVCVELLDCTEKDNVQVGETVVTGLINTTMPLVRYHLEDVVSINRSLSNCRCGNINNELLIIHGRTINTFNFNGTTISPHLLVTCVERVNNELGDSIKNFMFKYSTESKELTCIFCIENQFINWKSEIENLFTKYFCQHTQGHGLPIIRFEYQSSVNYNLNRKNQILTVEN